MATLQRSPRTVRDELALAGAPTVERGLLQWVREFLTSLQAGFRTHVHLFPAVAAGEVSVNVYTAATKPGAATVKAGSIIFVSDGGAGAQAQMSTGAAWINLG